jgi:hypothetical protein
MDRRQFMGAASIAAGAVATAWTGRLWAAGEMDWAAGMMPTGSPAIMAGSNVGFDRRSLFIDGQRRLIFSASYHYFRAPGKELWAQRLKSLKELGFNAIDTYYYWPYHTEAEGKYDFSGLRDIDQFHDLVEQAGLYLIARPGPYICAEVDGGGFPGWLIAKKDVLIRCRKDGEPVYDDNYMRYVKEWYEQIAPKIARRKNLILFQIENEYQTRKVPKFLYYVLKAVVDQKGVDAFYKVGSSTPVKNAMISGMKKAMKSKDYLASCEYMRELYKMSRALGVKVPIFHNDAGDPTKRWADVDIIGVDDYPIQSAGWETHDPFGPIDLMEEMVDATGRPAPLVIPEIQGGWYDSWGGPGYPFKRDWLGPNGQDMTLKSCLAQGAAVTNIYMAFGGTNWGYLADPDVYTSYDYGAPLTEGGAKSARGLACKHFADFAFRHEQDLAGSAPDPSVTAGNRQVVVKARRAESGNTFVFVRNLSGRSQRVELSLGHRLELPAPDMQVLVFDSAGKLIDSTNTYSDRTEPPLPTFSLPQLSGWTFSLYTDPIDPQADDRGWKEVAPGAPLDMDALGLHYGYVWYRGHYRGALRSFRLDARHCWAVYIDGQLVQGYDNFQNRVGSGDDLAKTVTVRVPARLQGPGDHLLTILVESLGHNKGALPDSQFPRGIAKIDPGKTAIAWRASNGLLPGESGITPVISPGALASLPKPERVSLPHPWPRGQAGIGVYRCGFNLNLPSRLSPVGVRLENAPEKASIYINGALIGRYWESLGPQKFFYLMPCLLNPSGENELMVALWPWKDGGGLGPIRLEVYP